MEMVAVSVDSNLEKTKRRDLKRKVYEAQLKGFDKDKGLPVHTLPYRTNLNINRDKLIEHEQFLKKDRVSFLLRLATRIKKELKRGDFVKGYEMGDKPLMEIMWDLKDTINKDYAGIFSDELPVTNSDLELLDNALDIRSKYTNFKSISSSLKTDSYLPINFKTIPYINFNKGKTLVEVRLSNINDEATIKTSYVLSEYITLLGLAELDIVHLETYKHSTEINIVSNNEGKDVIDFLVSILGHTSFEGLAYFVDITVINNVGQPNETEEIVHLFSSHAFSSIRDYFTETDRNTFSFKTYVSN